MLYNIESNTPACGGEGQRVLTEAPNIHKTSVVRKSLLGSYTDIGPNVSLNETEVGDYTYFAGEASAIYTKIGKFCSIASHVRINPGNHPQWRVTQHHCTYRRVRYGFVIKDDDDFFQWRRDDAVTIGHDVWLGHGVIVMAGVNIGTGAVIGSGAVVTKDIPPYAVAVGVPAKVIKMRFENDVIEKLMSTAWWDWDREKLESCFQDLLDTNIFLEKYYL